MLQTYRPRANDEVPTKAELNGESILRMQQWSKMFDLTPPKVVRRGGSIVWTPEMDAWMRKSMAPWDFIFGGDLTLIVDRYRRYTAALIVAQAEADRQPEVIPPTDTEPETDPDGNIRIPMVRAGLRTVFRPVRSVDDAIDVTPRG
jgi:hypothetical protein